MIGCQKDYVVNPKYGKKKRVASKSIPTIVLANPDEDWMKDMSPAQLEYFESNTVIYMMTEGERFWSFAPMPATASLASLDDAPA